MFAVGMELKWEPVRAVGFLIFPKSCFHMIAYFKREECMLRSWLNVPLITELKEKKRNNKFNCISTVVQRVPFCMLSLK